METDVTQSDTGTKAAPSKSVPMHLTLAARYYTDPVHFRREMDRFFHSRWIYAGRAEEIAKAGDFVLRDVAGESLIIVRGENGTLRAFHNVCRHRGTRICESETGKFNGRIQCPYHAWTYNYDGRLIGAPGMSEIQGFRSGDWPLHGVALETWDGHFFLNLSASPRPLTETLGALAEKFRPWQMEDLRLVKRTVYDIKANWKLIVQNYNECLHCPVIHPALNRLSHYLSGINEPPTPGFVGGEMTLREGVQSMTMDGTSNRTPLPGLGEEEQRRVYYYTLMPNLLLSLHPDYMLTHSIWPRAHDRTQVCCELHFHPDQMARPDFDPRGATEFWDMTNRQDWHVSELSQLGIGSRAYQPGPYSHREDLLWGIDDLVREPEHDAEPEVR